MRRILVTGASTWTGGRLVSRLERRGDTEVFAVDEIPPRVPFTSPFAQLGLDRTELAHHVLEVEPDAVVHLLTVDRTEELGRARAHEQAVLGVQALFGAIGRSRGVRRVVVKSDAAIYEVGPRNPSILGEDEAGSRRLSRYGRELLDLEQLVADVAPHHEHAVYTVLRLAPIFGPTVGNPLSRYLSLRVVPTLLGFDPRLHLLFEDDAVTAFLAALDRPVPGTFNVAPAEPIYLSRVLRLGRRIAQPLPRRLFDAALRGLARLDLYVPRHLLAVLKHGLVLDTTRMERRLGAVAPTYTQQESVLAGYGRLSPDDGDAE